jgi:hypothetical protein
MANTPFDVACLVILAQEWHGLLLRFSFDCTRGAKCLERNTGRDAGLSH